MIIVQFSDWSLYSSRGLPCEKNTRPNFLFKHPSWNVHAVDITVQFQSYLRAQAAFSISIVTPIPMNGTASKGLLPSVFTALDYSYEVHYGPSRPASLECNRQHCSVSPSPVCLAYLETSHWCELRPSPATAGRWSVLPQAYLTQKMSCCHPSYWFLWLIVPPERVCS